MKKLYMKKLGLLVFMSWIAVFTMVAQTTTWYAINSGDWDNPENWTLDPAGIVYQNPGGPGFPQNGDNIFIKNGVDITVPVKVEPLVLAGGVLTVNGSIDFLTTAGHNFSEIRGTGRILLGADNFPDGPSTHFTSQNQGEGTVVFKGNQDIIVGKNLSFYNLEIDLEATKNLVLGANVNVNGHLHIKNGGLKMGNDGSSRTLTVLGDIIVNQTGRITTATTGIHNIHAFGDILNSGLIKLTNFSVPNYNTNSTNYSVLTIKGNSNNKLVADGKVYLHRLVIDKGTDRTYRFTINPVVKENFVLFGRNNIANTDKALYIKNGTLELTGATYIHSLTEGSGDFYVPETGALWINGDAVEVHSTAISSFVKSLPGNASGVTSDVTSGATSDATSDATGSQSFSVHGLFRISAGLFVTNTHSFVVWNEGNALVRIEGGIIETPGFRAGGNQNGRWTYHQSGGFVKLYGDIDSDLLDSDAATFDIKGVNNSFIMSGGDIEVFDAVTSSDYIPYNTVHLAIRIESKPENISVTGGTVSIVRGDGSNDENFVIDSSAPFHNLVIGGTNNQTNVYLAQRLNILNDLTVKNKGEFDIRYDGGQYDIAIGGNLDLKLGGVFRSGSNTTTFNGNRNSSIINNSGSNLSLDNVIIEKDVNTGSFYTVGLEGSHSLNIGSNLELKRGNFDLDSKNVTVKGNISIYKGSVIGSGSFVLNGNNKQTLFSEEGKKFSLGNVSFDNRSTSGNQIEILSNVRVGKLEVTRQSGARQLIYLGIYSLEAAEGEFAVDGWSSTRMFKTSDKSSDGGLTLPLELIENYSPSKIVQFFPVGTSKYTPVTVNTNKDFSGANGASGKVTVVPVNSAHPTVAVQNQNSVTPYYWKVDFVEEEGVVVKSDLQYVFDYGSEFTGHTPVALVDTDWEVFDQISNKSKIATFPYAASLNGDFTVGGQGDGIFSSPRVLYSINSGPISEASTWSADADFKHEGPATTTAPQSYDFLVIGGNKEHDNHVVYIDSNDNRYSVSQVYIKGRSETSESFAGIPTLDVRNQNGGHNIPIIKGRGRIIYPNKTFINGDHTAFCSNNEAIIEFNGSGQTLEASVNVPFFPNLHFSGSGSWVGLDSKLVVNGNLYVDSLNSGVNFRLQRDAEIKGDLKVGNGIFSFPMNAGAEVYVGGDIQILGSGTLSYGGGNNIPRHTLRLHGNLSQGDGTINFYNSDNSKNVTLYFEGDESVVFSKVGEKDSKFYRIIVDKPEGRIVRFDNSLTLDGPTDTKDKALVINQGVAHFNSSEISIELTSGEGNFVIPSKGELRVSNSSIVTVKGDGVGVLLDGKLVVDAGGDAQLNKGTNNYVEYTSSGRSTIVVNGDGELIIGSQLRRSLLTEAGILKFAQNGAESIVVIGDNSAPETDRGVFEILNDGSEFVQGKNATLILKNQKQAGFSDLYFNPSLLSLEAGSRVQILKGQELTDAFNIYAPKDLRNLIVGDLEDEAKSVNVRLDIVGVETEENLEIYGISDFDASGLDVVVRKDLINNGSYSHNQNTTSFSGLGKQSISGNTEFYNLIKTGLGELSLGENTLITVKQNIILEKGVFNTLETDVVVEGNVSIGDNAYTLSGDASQGVVMQGSSIQNLSGGGTFAKLTINNDKGINVPTQEASVGIAQELRMVKGVLSIGQNLLVLKKGAKILPINSFGSGNMIQTNLSFADAGVMMYLTGESQKIIFPIGAANKYSPVDFNINSLSASNASIRVVAANEHHISVDDPDNALQYYWTLAASNLTGFSGYAIMTGEADDAMVTSGYSVNDYWAAYILSNSDLWNKIPYVTDGVNSVEGDLYEGFKIVDGSAKLAFVFDNGNISGDYTAGVEYKNDEDLFQAIPDNIPSYVTVAHGLWTAASTWRRMDNGASEVPGRGSIIYVNHLLDVNESNMSALRAYISEDGVIDFKTHINHRINEVYGKGRLRFARGSLPAGRYDDFFSAEGGTIEFYGNNDYTILGDIPAVNHLVISDGGFKRIASNLTVRGTLGLGVGAGLEQAMSGSTLTVHGDIKNSGGTYLPNLGIVSMKGVNRQNIEGGLDFYDFEVNNPEGVNLVNNDAVVARRLRLLKGLLYSSETAMPYLTNADNNEAVEQVVVSSFVSGPLRKYIVAGTSFNFPVGKDARLGLANVNPLVNGEWVVEYFNEPDVDRLIKSTEVDFVSNNEYWNIKPEIDADQAKVALRWDSQSGVNPSDPSFQLLQFTDKWIPIPRSNPDLNIKLVQTQNYLTFNNSGYSKFTFGFAAPEVGDFTWTGAVSDDWFIGENWGGGSYPSGHHDVTIGEDVILTPERMPVIRYQGDGIVAYAQKLLVESGYFLTLAPGGKLTVNNLHVGGEGGLILQNNTDKNGLSSVITNGIVSGEKVRIQMTVPNDKLYYTTQPIEDPMTEIYVVRKEDGTFDSDRVFVHVHRNGQWLRVTGGGAALFDMEGVAMRFIVGDGNYHTVNYLGYLNNHQQSRNFTKKGYYYFGNPYPSFINWQSDEGWLSRSNMSGTIWYRTRVGDEMAFVGYNRFAKEGARASVYPDNVDVGNEQDVANIPPYQSVLLYSFGDGVVTVDNSIRTHGVEGGGLKSSSSSATDIIRIVASNSSAFDGTVLYFTDDATDGIDLGDSEKVFNSSAKIPEVYTRMGETAMAINGLSPLENETRIIPLSVRNQIIGEEVSLTFDLRRYNGVQAVYLEDRETGAFVNLMHDNSYSYIVRNKGDNHERFSLHFYYISTDLESSEVDGINENLISIRSISNKVLVSVGMELINEGSGIVEIYTIEGRKVSEVPALSSRTLVILPSENGVYIIRARFGKHVKSQRVIR